MSWLADLGEKSSRTDVWVGLIVLQYVCCLFNLIECSQNWYIDIITIGMFTDLGINTVATKFLSK